MKDRNRPEKDYLWQHIRSLPYFRSLLRAVEARFYQDIPLAHPTLDIGCGDGHFASVAFDRQLEVGLDPDRKSIREAGDWGGYLYLVQASGDRMPFPEATFASAVSNSVLEHIPGIDAVLEEIHRVLRPGGRFVFCVPNHQLLQTLSISRMFEDLGIRRLAAVYRGFFNRIARHYHSDSPEVWEARLENSGFQVEDWWHYFTPEATAVMEWGHYFGTPSLVWRKLTGRWILAPAHWNLALTEYLIRPYYQQDPVSDLGTYTFYVTRRSD